MTQPRSMMLRKPIQPKLAVRLVLGVSRLGEADLAGWWSSQGMNAAVRFTLAGFRRTSKVVGAELAVLSATRRHRQVMPRDTAVHLFSPHLPFARWTRAYLAEQKTSDGSALIDELLSWRTTETARAKLDEWCGAVEASTHEGSSVSVEELQDPAVAASLLARFAGGYTIHDGELLVPYVDLLS